MASNLARQKVAVAWCKESTKDREMDVVLAEEFAKILDEYIDALRWCSASSDFQVGGKARRGWNKVAKRLLTIR